MGSACGTGVADGRASPTLLEGGLPVMPWKAWVAAVAIAGAAFAADRADAAPNVAHLSWGSQLNPSDCPDDGYRYSEVNVTGQVAHDADQAPAGDYPARREYSRHRQ